MAVNDLRVTTQTSVYIIDRNVKTLTRKPNTKGMNSYQVASFAGDNEVMLLDSVEHLVVGESALFYVRDMNDPFNPQYRRSTPVISIEEIVQREAETSWL